jgi:predicted phage terminase large subunit-like protein
VRALALDPSKGADSRHGDYSAYALVGIDQHATVYVEADMARRPTPEMVEAGVRICDRFDPDAFGVETNQYQELLKGEFERAFRERHVRLRMPRNIDNQTNKTVRIRKLGPYLSQRRLRFLSKSVSTRMLVDQLRDFPLGAHDDGPDALEMAIRLAETVMSGEAMPSDGLGGNLLTRSL